MPEAKFLLKEPKANSKSLIYLIFRFNNNRLKVSTGEKILPKFWNNKKQRCKEISSFPEFPEFNQRLNNIETAINNCYRSLLNDKLEISVESLKTNLLKEIQPKATSSKEKISFLNYLNNEVEYLKSLQKITKLKAYRALHKHLSDFENIQKKEIKFENIDYSFYETFLTFLSQTKKLKKNTCGKQIKTLKNFLNIMSEKSINTFSYYRSNYFKVVTEEVYNIYLSLEELEKIASLDLSNKKYLDKVRDLFIIGCFTGLRFSDFSKLQKENFQINNDTSFITVITKKTEQKVIIPVKNNIKNILKKYDGDLPQPISNQKMNVYLKQLAEMAGINQPIQQNSYTGSEKRITTTPKYKLVSTHTARRSFATNAYVNGVPPLSIMRITGHKTESAFMRYIKISEESNATLLASHKFFN